MGDHDTAQELEHRAAREPVHPAVPTIDPSLDDAMAALVRRGFHDVSRAKLDLPFDPDAYVRVDDIARVVADDPSWTIEVHERRPRPPGAASSHHVDDVVFRARRER